MFKVGQVRLDHQDPSVSQAQADLQAQEVKLEGVVELVFLVRIVLGHYLLFSTSSFLI